MAFSLHHWVWDFLKQITNQYTKVKDPSLFMLLINKEDYEAICVRARNAAEHDDYKKLTLEYEKLLH